MPLHALKTLPQYLIPQQGLSALAGKIANCRQVGFKNRLIQWFIKKYGVDMTEALVEDPTAYGSFNEFFIRRLKPDCRSLAGAQIVSPVDGCISEIGGIAQGQLLQAKGRYYSVQDLLACESPVAERFVQGHFATLYLSPKDYHRVHMPIDGHLQSMTYIPGELFSVQPATVQTVPRLFARNERLVLHFQTALGPMALVMVGAVIVGAMGTRWTGDLPRSNKSQLFTYTDTLLQQGEELGYFKLGSTVILLFGNPELQWEQQAKAGKVIRFGEALGSGK